MREDHAQEYLQTRYSDDELLQELDRRLDAQGLRVPGHDADGAIGLEQIINYLREGWAVIALPPELAAQIEMTPANGQTIHHLAGELRRRILSMEESERAAGR